MSDYRFELILSTQRLLTDNLGPGDVFEVERGTGKYGVIVEMDDALEKVTLWARVYTYDEFAWAPVYKSLQRELATVRRVAHEVAGRPLTEPLVAYLRHREMRDRERFSQRSERILCYPRIGTLDEDCLGLEFCVSPDGALLSLPLAILCWRFGDHRLLAKLAVDRLQSPPGELSRKAMFCSGGWVSLPAQV